MKKKTIKFLLWTAFLLGATYFVFYPNGNFTKLNSSQLTVSVYAFLSAFAWAFLRRLTNNKSSGFMSAVFVFATILGVSYFIGSNLSPTQMVAVVALFFYASKVVRYSLAK